MSDTVNNPLRNPLLRRYAIGRLLSTFGSQMQATAVGWQLYERTGSAWALAYVGLVEVIPSLVLALPAGQLIDRRDRRRVAMAAQFALSIAALGLAAVSWRSTAPFSSLPEGISVAAIYALLFVAAVAAAFNSPANSALLPQLIPSDELARANAWISSGQELSSMAGPAAAGALIALTGAATIVYVMEAGTALVFVAMLATLPSRATVFAPALAIIPDLSAPSQSGAAATGMVQEKRAPALSDMFAGLRFVWRSEVFLAAITLDLFAVLLGGATALLPMFARDILKVSATGLGLLRSAPSFGAFAMALVSTRLPPWKKPGRVLLITVAGFGVATIGFGLSRNFMLSFCLLVLTGLFDNISVVIRTTLGQVLTPDHMRGRVGAIYFVFIGLSNEMGAFESGATAAIFGPVASVVGGGIGTLLVVLLTALRWPALVRLAQLDGLDGRDRIPAGDEKRRQSE